MKSQYEEILDHLQSGKSITALEALTMYGCLRLASRIYEMKQNGFTIKPETFTDPRSNKQYSKYSLESECVA